MTMSEELINPSTGEIVRYQPGPLLPTRQSPAELAQQSGEIREMMKAVLVDGTDYGTIPGVNRPSLFKPGAEWLLKWAGYGHRLEPVEVERDAEGRKFGVTYRCSVHLLSDSAAVVSTCDGYAGYDEDRFYQSVVALEAKERGNASRYQRPAKPEKWAEPYRAPWNSVLKMAEKRAFVGATLQATATSGLFTQDMEDVIPVAPPVAPTPMASAEDVALITDRIAALPEDDRARLREAWKAVPLPAPSALAAAMLPDAHALLDTAEAEGKSNGEPFDSPAPPTDATGPPVTEPAPDLMQEVIDLVKGMSIGDVRAALEARSLVVQSDTRRQRMDLSSAIYKERGGVSLGTERPHLDDLPAFDNPEFMVDPDDVADEPPSTAPFVPDKAPESSAATDAASGLFDGAGGDVAEQVAKMVGGKVTAELVKRGMEIDGDLPARRERLAAAMVDEMNR